jgi:hypothetical protein
MNALSILTNEQLQALREEVKGIIDYPFMQVCFSDLGGINERSAMITVSIDKKEDWCNGYIENSRYTRFHYEPNNNNELQQFVKSGIVKKFRLCRPENIIEAAKKIKKYLDENK